MTTQPPEDGDTPWSQKPATRWLGSALVISALLYLLNTVWQSRSDVSALARTADLRWVAVATACVLVAEALVSVVWSELIKRLDSAPRLVAIRAYALSGVARFLPGLVGYAGRAGLASQYGIGLRAAALAASFETILSFAAAVTLAALGASQILAPEWNTGLLTLLVAGLLAATITVLPVVTKKILPGDGQPSIPRQTIIVAYFGYCAAWSMLGLALLALVGATGSGFEAVSPIAAIGVISGSWAIGLAALVVPGGLGVREAAVTAALAPFVGPGLSLVIAFGHRLVWWLALSLMYVAGHVLGREAV